MGKKPQSAQHVLSGEELKLHNSMKSCLDVHSECMGYKPEKPTCCYRWQAHAFAKANQREIFDDRSNALIGKRKSFRTSAQESVKEVIDSAGNKVLKRTLSPQNYAFRLRAPQFKDDWALDGPKRAAANSPAMAKHGLRQAANLPKKKTFADGANFRKQVQPYWNEAHHLIPKDLLKTELAKFPPAITEALRLALLKSGYNIHHEINMQFLPGDQEVGKVLRLPRHLSLEGGGKFNHEMYNLLVENRLREVLRDISSDVDQKEHKFKNPDTSKKKLENISADCRRRLLDFGSSPGPGKSLDEIEFIPWSSPWGPP